MKRGPGVCGGGGGTPLPPKGPGGQRGLRRQTPEKGTGEAPRGSGGVPAPLPPPLPPAGTPQLLRAMLPGGPGHGGAFRALPWRGERAAWGVPVVLGLSGLLFFIFP